MGAMCCCLSSVAFEDYLPHQHSALWRQCSCLGSCLPWFFPRYDEVNSQEASSVSSATTTSSNSSHHSVDTSMPEIFQAPPPPLPYDSDQRYLRNAGGLISRRDKSGMSHHAAEGGTALLRRYSNGGIAAAEQQEDGLKPSVVDKTGIASKFPRVESALSVSDDDDNCPTCLEEYTAENPRIDTECAHHFHLSCIYEWMLRSNRCPICDKEMVFSENRG